MFSWQCKSVYWATVAIRYFSIAWLLLGLRLAFAMYHFLVYPLVLFYTFSLWTFVHTNKQTHKPSHGKQAETNKTHIHSSTHTLAEIQVQSFPMGVNEAYLTFIIYKLEYCHVCISASTLFSIPERPVRRLIISHFHSCSPIQTHRQTYSDRPTQTLKSPEAYLFVFQCNIRNSVLLSPRLTTTLKTKENPRRHLWKNWSCNTATVHEQTREKQQKTKTRKKLSKLSFWKP